jgi:DNA-binding response OmpR family regulator
MRCLIVEDDARIAADIVRALGRAGFRAEHALDGDEAWFRGGTEDHAPVVLDLGLPRLDGLSVLRRWRAERVDTPLLVLTARGRCWTERVEELVARARALVRRASGRMNPVQEINRLALDTNRQTASVDGRPLDLTPLEFRLLNYLVHAGDRVATPGELLEHLYGDDDAREANALEAVIARLRRKTEPGVIGTRRGFGYFLERGA